MVLESEGLGVQEFLGKDSGRLLAVIPVSNFLEIE